MGTFDDDNRSGALEPSPRGAPGAHGSRRPNVHASRPLPPATSNGRGGYQGPVGFAVHTVVTWLLNRLVVRGGWTLIAWQGDWIARKRTTVVKRRYPTQSQAIEAWEDLAATIVKSGPPVT